MGSSVPWLGSWAKSVEKASQAAACVISSPSPDGRYMVTSCFKPLLPSLSLRDKLFLSRKLR